MSAFRRLYGAPPWHLLVLLACFAATGYVVSLLLDDLPVLVRIAIWFVGAALAWDLLLGPALALGDRLLRPLLQVGRVPVLNFVRVPALVSALLLLVWAPLVLQRTEGTYGVKTGLSSDPYLERWLAVTGVLFAASALLYVRAARRARRATTRG